MGQTNTNRRVALLIETDGPGGAERMVAQLATGLQSVGHSVVVFVPPRSTGWLASQLTGTGIEIDHFWLTRPFDPGCARELAASMRGHGIEIAHSHEFSLGFYGAWASRLLAIPHVITMHGRVYWRDRLRRRLALRTAVMASAATVAVSRRLARQLARDIWLREERISVIPNGVHLARVERSTLREELGLSQHERLVLAVGNLYPVKGHRHLLDALAMLQDRHPDAHLAIAGQGQLADGLRSQAEQLGLGSRLHLLGLRSDVANLLAGADVFALPSLEEGLPLALLEAMLAGKRIVATSVGDNPAVLGAGRCGVLVKPGRAEELAAALDRLLTGGAEVEAMARAARERADSEYRLEHMTACYEGLYREIGLMRTVATAEAV